MKGKWIDQIINANEKMLINIDRILYKQTCKNSISDK